MKLPLRVLIIHQSEDDASLIQRALQQNGYELTFKHVETPAALRATLAGNSWDLIVSSANALIFDEHHRSVRLNQIEHSISSTLHLPTVLSRLVQ